MTSQPRGNVIIDPEECKGCGLCVESCPPECLYLAPELNKYGVHAAQYTGRTALAAVLASTAALSRGYYREPAGSTAKTTAESRRTSGGAPCGSSVKETSPS